jgi:hypothetical protein
MINWFCIILIPVTVATAIAAIAIAGHVNRKSREPYRFDKRTEEMGI